MPRPEDLTAIGNTPPGPPGNQYQDPMALLQALLGQDAPDFKAMADKQVADIYGPLYGNLDRSTSLALQNTERSNAQLDAMYRALQGGISAQSGNINKSYDLARAGVDSAYNQGISGIRGNYSNAMGENAALMQQLGIQDAARDPRTLQQQAGQEAFLSSLLSAGGASAKNEVEQKRQGSLDFNTASSNAAGAAGVQARQNLLFALNNRLSAIQDQRGQLQSQQAQAAMQAATGYQNAWMTQQQALAKMIYDAQNNEANRQNDLQKAYIAAQPNAYQQYRMEGPLNRAYSQAAQLFGTNGDNASRAVNLVLSVGNQNQQYANPYAFIDAVRKANQALAAKDATQALPDDAIASLAATMWQELNPQYNINGMANAPLYSPNNP